MSQHTIYKCERCRAVAENPYAKAGWVRVDGSITVAAGFYGASSYATAYLDQRTRDFCSMKCLVEKLDELMQERLRKGDAPAQLAAPSPVGARDLDVEVQK